MEGRSDTPCVVIDVVVFVLPVVRAVFVGVVGGEIESIALVCPIDRRGGEIQEDEGVILALQLG
jgi:hypothetical protein